LGLKRALVVHGSDGLDEITISGPTYVSEVRNGSVSSYQIEPQEFGITCAPLEALTGGDAVANAEAIRDILRGEMSPKRDVVLLNAAAALVAAGKTDSIAEAIPIAKRSLDEGAAAAKLRALVQFSQTNPAHSPVMIPEI
jgi:anthranilate phosphoribosyltransferase